MFCICLCHLYKNDLLTYLLFLTMQCRGFNLQLIPLSTGFGFIWFLKGGCNTTYLSFICTPIQLWPHMVSVGWMSLSYTNRIPDEAYLQCGRRSYIQLCLPVKYHFFCRKHIQLGHYSILKTSILFVGRHRGCETSFLNCKCLNVVGSSVGQDIIDQFALHRVLDIDSRFGFQI